MTNPEEGSLSKHPRPEEGSLQQRNQQANLEEGSLPNSLQHPLTKNVDWLNEHNSYNWHKLWHFDTLTSDNADSTDTTLMTDKNFDTLTSDKDCTLDILHINIRHINNQRCKLIHYLQHNNIHIACFNKSLHQNHLRYIQG